MTDQVWGNEKPHLHKETKGTLGSEIRDQPGQAPAPNFCVAVLQRLNRGVTQRRMFWKLWVALPLDLIFSWQGYVWGSIVSFGIRICLVS